MTLEELSMTLKDTAELIDSFVSSAEEKSAEKYCEECIDRNDLGYIRDEIRAAFRWGFRTAYRQVEAKKIMGETR